MDLEPGYRRSELVLCVGSGRDDSRSAGANPKGREHDAFHVFGEVPGVYETYWQVSAAFVAGQRSQSCRTFAPADAPVLRASQGIRLLRGSRKVH